MPNQMTVKPTRSPLLPAQFTVTGSDGNSQTKRLGAGIAGKEFDARVNEHGDQWVMVNGIVVLAGLNPSGLAQPLAVDPYGNLTVNTTGYSARSDVTWLASGARTTTQTSPDIAVGNYAYLRVIVDTTVFGTGSVTLTINTYDQTSGKYVLLLAGAAIVSTVTNAYNVGPTIVAAANVSATAQLGKTIQLVATANNANSQTYSVGYCLSVN